MAEQEDHAFKLSKNLAKKHHLAVFDEGQIATRTKRGMQMAKPSPLLKIWLDSADGVHPLVDIGCAYGINTLEAVRQGIATIGIDLGEEHFPLLRELYHELTSNSLRPLGSLQLISASVLEPLPIDDASLAGIVMGEVLHFIPGDAAAGVFKQLYAKLIPGGTLCLHGAHLDGMAAMINGPTILEEIERKRLAGVRWPGEMTDVSLFMNNILQPLDFPDNAKPDFFHVFSLEQVRALAEEAGFEIVSLAAAMHPGYPEFMRTSTSNLQLHARRPGV